MQSAAIPENEVDRLKSLFDYHVLDTAPEEAFDQLTALASSICGTPIALVSLIDESRQWFKSHHGLEATETPRELAFCAHAIHQKSIFEVQDSREDERFADNPLVTGAPEVIFYAGAPLQTPDGFNIGTLCVIDHQPSKLSELQKHQLGIIAKQVVAQLELQKNGRIKEQLFGKLMSLTKNIDARNEELNTFSIRAAHDLKGPILRIEQLAHSCIEDIAGGQAEKAAHDCGSIVKGCRDMDTLISDIFSLTRANIRSDKRDDVNIKKLVLLTLSSVENLVEERQVNVDYQINLKQSFSSESIRLQQILYNLMSNAIKYSDPSKETRYVSVVVDECENGIVLTIKDNGLGIPKEQVANIFSPFERFHTDAAEGTGLGMAIVKKHVDALGGTIKLSSDPSGTEFRVELPNGMA